MARLQEYDIVRVVKLKRADRPFDGTESIKRPPRIGDVATICHEYDATDPECLVAVEMVSKDGFTVWIADFDRAELDFVKRP